MQECLCILVCDDSEDVSLAAQAFFRYLHSSHGKHHIKHDFTQIFRRWHHSFFFLPFDILWLKGWCLVPKWLS